MSHRTNWSEPISPGPWRNSFEPLVLCWDWVLSAVDDIRKDALGARDWAACAELVDSWRPSPILDVEEAASLNARWREFVVAVWRMRDAWLTRRRKQVRR